MLRHLLLLTLILCVCCEKTYNSIIPQKSPKDKRKYQALVLPNQLKILLIQDAQTTKSACSITVGAASLQQPGSAQGLAHFLQHMLFQGSKKFPGVNQFKQFISTNSGSTNAETGDRVTSYYYDIKNSVFQESIERITDFFIAPLLIQGSINKQIHAVDSQYNLRLNNDVLKVWNIIKELAEPPFSYFDYGNIQSLNQTGIRDKLIEFYNTYYSSNLLTVALYSNIPIEQQKQKFIKFFEQIPNRNAVLPEMGPIYNKQNLSQLIFAQSINNQYTIQFFYVISPIKNQYKYHIQEYIDYVLNNQGQNSLFQYLKMRGFGSSINLRSYDLISNHIISIQLKIATEGYRQYEYVYNIVCDYLQNIKIERYLYEQLKQRNKVRFFNIQKSEPMSYCSYLSAIMQDIPIQNILTYSTMFAPFEEAVKALELTFSEMRPENELVVVSSDEQVEDAIQGRFFNNKYKLYALPNRVDSQVRLESLARNPYLPVTNYPIKAAKNPSLWPQKIGDTILFYRDTQFGVDKGGIQIRVYSEEDYTFLVFYVQYFKLLFKKIIYPAQTISADVTIKGYSCFTIEIYGYTDTVMKLLENIAKNLRKLHQGEQSEFLFELANQGTLNIFLNKQNQDPDDYATDILQIMQTSNEPQIQYSLQQVKSFKYQKLLRRIKRFWTHNLLRWVVVGNFDKNKIKNLISRAQKSMQGTRNNYVDVKQFKTIKLTQNLTHHVFLKGSDVTSSCALVYYQIGPYSDDLYYKLLVLQNYISEPFYTQLRTQRKLGYSLKASIDKNRGILGLYFYLVTSVVNPKNASDQIKLFVNKYFGQMKNKLQENDGQLLTTLKQSVFTDIQTPIDTVKDRFDFITSQVFQRTYKFNRKQQEQIRSILDPITADDLIQLWNSIRAKTIDINVVARNHLKQYQQLKVPALKMQAIKKKSMYWEDFIYVYNENY